MQRTKGKSIFSPSGGLDDDEWQHYDFVVYTDGSYTQGSKKGGWAFCVYDCAKNFLFEQSGHSYDSTNNIEEMSAVVAALRFIRATLPQGATACVLMDSQYVQKGLTEWLAGWKRNAWKTSSGGEVKNVDLWHRLDALQQDVYSAGVTVQLRWVRGHNGEAGNERVDKLAGKVAAQQYAEPPCSRTALNNWLVRRVQGHKPLPADEPVRKLVQKVLAATDAKPRAGRLGQKQREQADQLAAHDSFLDKLHAQAMALAHATAKKTRSYDLDSTREKLNPVVALLDNLLDEAVERKLLD